MTKYIREMTNQGKIRNYFILEHSEDGLMKLFMKIRSFYRIILELMLNLSRCKFLKIMRDLKVHYLKKFMSDCCENVSSAFKGARWMPWH